MKRWLYKLIGGVPRSDYMYLYKEYLKVHKDIQDTIDLHQMQGAWEQVKQKRRALH